jgi:phenylacetate-CoA ligase
LRGVIFLPAFEISRQNVAEYVRVVRRSGAEFLRGYATALYLMSKWMTEAELQLRLHAVFSTAEMLYAPQRALIADRLGEVFDYCGCGEVNSIAFECDRHQGMHVSDEHVLVEVLRDGERVPEGEMGAMTLTTLQNRTMPLIRYQNGDLVAWSGQPCPCGRGLSRLVKLFGRANDLLLASDGRLVSGVFMPTFFTTVGLQGVKQVQLIQEEKDVIHLKVVKDVDYSDASLRPLLDVIARYLGDVKIDVEYASSIPAAPSGKIRYVISKVVGDL